LFHLFFENAMLSTCSNSKCPREKDAPFISTLASGPRAGSETAYITGWPGSNKTGNTDIPGTKKHLFAEPQVRASGFELH